MFPRLDPPAASVGPALEMDVSAPARKQVGGHATYQIVVRNNSAEPALGLSIRCRFDAPLEFPGSEVHEVLRRVDVLEAGETKELPLSLTSRQTGSQCCQFTLLRHAGERDVEVASQTVCVEFVARQLDIEIVGPRTRTEGSRAEFNVLLANRSTRPLSRVQATLSFDRALKAREASRGYRRTGQTLVWDLGALEPMESVQLQVDLECQGLARRACVTLEVRADQFAPEQDEACLEIVPVPGTLDLRVADRDDPLEVGRTGVFEATVHNIGLQQARNIRLSVTMPEHVRVLGAGVRVGETRLAVQFEQKEGAVVFDTVDTLAADATLTYAIEVEALRAGAAEFTARLTSSLTSTPVVASEPTIVQEP
ncbi:MAG: hypothetical protein ACT4QC_14170 [Planctomycetaceae bacterium]